MGITAIATVLSFYPSFQNWRALFADVPPSHNSLDDT